jgi:hypothetical protein
MMLGSLASMHNSFPGAGLGFASIIVFPVLYGIIGAIGGGLTALIYNLAAGWVGGLEVDIT